jgi:uncharacterized protein (DUF58 family)
MLSPPVRWRASPVQLKASLTPEYLSRILSLKLRARAVLEGTLAGWHPSPFHGYSSEFSQYKGYAPGDDIKHLDWKVYGRRDQLVLRQYRDETNASVHLVIDTSASMGYRSGPLSKLEYASVLAASLTLLAERQRDAVSLAQGDLNLKSFLPPESGPLRTRELLHRLESLTPGGRTDLETLFAEVAPHIAGQSFVFLFTDLWQNPSTISTGLQRIRLKSRTVVLVQLRTRDEADFFEEGSYRLRDLETGEELEVSAAQARSAYLAGVKEHADAMAKECARLGVRLIPIRTDWPCDAALRSILPRV